MDTGRGPIRAGDYAKANIASRSWLQTPMAANSKGKNIRKVQTVVYPVFSKCSELTTDPFWIDIFNNASKGKFPKGFSYKEGCLFHRRRNKTSSVEVSENAIEAFDTCKTFFRTMGGIASQQEHSKNDSEDAASESLDDTSDNTGNTSEISKIIWSKIVPKKNKTLYLHSFISNFAKKNNMISFEIDKLQKILNLAETLGLLTDTNVIFEGNSISQINELTFDPITRQINFEPLNRPQDSSKRSNRSSRIKTSNGKQGLFLKLWEKYLTNYVKNKNASAPPITGAPKTTLVIRTSQPEKI